MHECACTFFVMMYCMRVVPVPECMQRTIRYTPVARLFPTDAEAEDPPEIQRMKFLNLPENTIRYQKSP